MVGKGIVIRIMVFPVLCLLMLSDGRAYAELPPPPPEVKIAIMDGQGDPLDHWIDFGELIVNGPVVSNTVTVTNEGTAQVEMAISNSPGPPFSVVNNCPGLLNSSGFFCDIRVEFAAVSNTGDFPDELGISFVKDAVTLEETVSLTARVITAEDQRPSAPGLISPANGSVVVGNMVDFSWSESTDPEGGLVTYDLFICDNQTFTGCVAPAIANTESTSGTVDMGGMSFAGTAAVIFFAIAIAGGISRRRLTALLFPVLLMAGLLLHSCGGGGGEPPPNPPSGTEYFWKVVAADEDGNRTDSETWSFTVR